MIIRHLRDTTPEECSQYKPNHRRAANDDEKSSSVGREKLKNPLPFLFPIPDRGSLKKVQRRRMFPLFNFVCCWLRAEEDTTGWKFTKTVSPGLIFARSSSFSAAPLRNMFNDADEDDDEIPRRRRKPKQFFLNSPTVIKPEETSMTFVSELCCIVRTVIFILRSINHQLRKKKKIQQQQQRVFKVAYVQVILCVHQNINKYRKVHGSSLKVKQTLVFIVGTIFIEDEKILSRCLRNVD